MDYLRRTVNSVLGLNLSITMTLEEKKHFWEEHKNYCNYRIQECTDDLEERKKNYDYCWKKKQAVAK